MSSKPSATSHDATVQPAWLAGVLGTTIPEEGGRFCIGTTWFMMRDGIPRADAVLSMSQQQTRDTYEFLWDSADRFASTATLTWLAEWFTSHYGDVAGAAWWAEYGDEPLLLEVGCGTGLSAFGLLGDRLTRVRYLGVDVSNAVDAARARWATEGMQGAFLQASLMDLPLPSSSVDVIYAQGVLHHTDSTEAAIRVLADRLKPGGRLLFYVYRRKGPIREFTDDYVRAKLQGLSPHEAWAAMMPLTKLGQLLGDLKVTIQVPEPIDLFEIPAGEIDLQRLFYWHVFKAFHHPDMTRDELNHFNLDWYLPTNAHRHTPEEVRGWCRDADLAIEHEHVQESGITIIAKS